MTDPEKKADREDKLRFYEEARFAFLEACKRADMAERLALVEREHAKKMGERVNQRLRDLD